MSAFMFACGLLFGLLFGYLMGFSSRDREVSRIRRGYSKMMREADARIADYKEIMRIASGESDDDRPKPPLN